MENELIEIVSQLVYKEQNMKNELKDSLNLLKEKSYTTLLIRYQNTDPRQSSDPSRRIIDREVKKYLGLYAIFAACAAYLSNDREKSISFTKDAQDKYRPLSSKKWQEDWNIAIVHWLLGFLYQQRENTNWLAMREFENAKELLTTLIVLEDNFGLKKKFARLKAKIEEIQTEGPQPTQYGDFRSPSSISHSSTQPERQSKGAQPTQDEEFPPPTNAIISASGMGISRRHIVIPVDVKALQPPDLVSDSLDEDLFDQLQDYNEEVRRNGFEASRGTMPDET